MTIQGRECLVWTDFDEYDVGEHNYCRSWGYSGVWCFTSSTGEWDFCPVPTCPCSAYMCTLYIPADNDLSHPRAYTSWLAPAMSFSWTICSAIMLKDWPSAKSSELYVWRMTADERDRASLQISATESGTTFLASYNILDTVRISTGKTLFPGKWIRSCFSRKQTENNETQLTLVINGSLIAQEKYDEEPAFAEKQADKFDLVLGNSFPGWTRGWGSRFRGITTDVNMFSTALTTGKMVETTNGDNSESCGQPGDLVSWANTAWILENNATMLGLDKILDSPCRRESSVNIFVIYGLHHSRIVCNTARNSDRDVPLMSVISSSGKQCSQR